MKSIIMIPTYNERKNLPLLVKALDALSLADLGYLIIDDNSPDGTGTVADQLAEESDHVFVLHRQKKEGLGRAYVDGFSYAIDHLGADIIFTMDADLSHDPKKIPEFLTAVQSADLIIGSRYTDGGSIHNWSVFRKLVSAFGNFYARTILSMPVKDLTTGYMCFRKAVIQSIGLESLVANGYVFLIELKYFTHKNGFRLAEVPITFTERREGLSKFSFNIFYEAFVRVLQLRFKRVGKKRAADAGGSIR